MESGFLSFDVGQVLQIAENLDRNGALFYAAMKTAFVDDLRRDLCQALADWRTARERSLAQRRKQFHEQKTEPELPDGGECLQTHSPVMTYPAVFADTLYRSHTPTGRDSLYVIVDDAIARTQQAIGFYRGLKDFARDQQARAALDRIIGEERRYIRFLNQESRANDRFQRIGITTYRKQDIT